MGVQCPEEAWKRLEELYGNQELSILSALKNLREFRPTKSAAHEQVIELAMAAQKCLMILKNVDAVGEFLGDQESLACVIQALPPTVRDKWYNLDVPEETRAKGEFLVKWHEKQRQNTVRVHLDTMASKMRETAPPPSRSTPRSPESIDKGLSSNSLHTQGSDRDTTEGGGRGGQPKDKPKSAWIEVKTLQDALQITERRKASLEGKKMDKCPVCDGHHHYERTWTTHLTMCTKFLALSPDEKLATVLGNAACLHCTSWDHTTHKFQGGKLAKDPKCAVIVGGAACGGAHGRWFHKGSSAGSTHLVVVATARQGPGLYKVYSMPMHARETTLTKLAPPAW